MWPGGRLCSSCDDHTNLESHEQDPRTLRTGLARAKDEAKHWGVPQSIRTLKRLSEVRQADARAAVAKLPPLKKRTAEQRRVVSKFRIAAIVVQLVTYETIRTYQTKRHLDSQSMVLRP